MGFILKLCVYVILFFVVSLNLSYYCKYFFSSGKDSHHDVADSRRNLEPLTIRGNGGRLGNQMFVFATLYGLARLNKRNISLLPNNQEALQPYFELNFPKINFSSFRVRNPWKIGYWLTEADRSIPPTSNIVAGNMYPTSFTFFDHVREDIRKIFRFRAPFRKHAEDVLRHVKMLRPWTKVFVCVHVRRGDYLRKSNGGWLRAAEGREVDLPYFRKAVQYFRARYRNITFLAVSDDRKWTKDNLLQLGILTLPESEGPGHDLAVLSSCNHTVVTYGSFGFWGAFLAGGEVVYFDDFVKPGSKMSEIFVYEKMYPKEWVGISTTHEGFWDRYTNPFMAG